MQPEVPFQVRRARLLLATKQLAFAEMFEVDTSTVSRWERGLLHPSPKVWSRIREIVLKSQSLYSDPVIQASHVIKFVVPVNNLTQPCVISKGVIEALVRVGVEPSQLTGRWWYNFAHKSAQYDITAVKALEIVEADEAWHSGKVAYAEAHCFAPKLVEWVNLMVAPLPDRRFALIEAVEDPDGMADGFWVRLIKVEDLDEARHPNQKFH